MRSHSLSGSLAAQLWRARLGDAARQEEVEARARVRLLHGRREHVEVGRQVVRVGWPRVPVVLVEALDARELVGALRARQGSCINVETVLRQRG